jgi:transposase
MSDHMYIIHFTFMRRKNPSDDAKVEALRRQGALHPRPEVVQDQAFQREEFLDPRDRVQVKYEMLRRHRLEGEAVTEVSASFGVSRPTFYLAEAAFEREGLPGLVPGRRGPRRAHKCTDEVLDFVEQWRQDPSAQTLGEAIQQRFGVQIHPRSIDRALARRKKKPARKEPGP